MLVIQENTDQFADCESIVMQLRQVEDRQIETMIELQVLKALTLVDQGRNHEAISELEQIIAIKVQSSRQEGELSNASDQLLQLQILQRTGRGYTSSQRRQQFCLLLRAIIQRRIGEHDGAIDAASEVIRLYPEYKDAYFVRGQNYLLKKRPQKAVQDFLEYNNLAQQEYQASSAVQ